MEKIKKFIKNEAYGWSRLEIIWLLFSSAVILGLSIYWGESLIGIIAAITGVFCVVFTGKGKISSYIFGTINTVLYAYIAFGAKYYGEVMLNVIYYLPMNFVGFAMWKKYINAETQEVEKRKLDFKYQLGITVLCCVCIYGYGLILKALGGNLPFVDSISTVLSVFAQILCAKRYMEQWVLWIVVDVVTVFMWVAAFFNGGESMATLIMWSVYLLNAVFMFIKWYKECKANEAK